MEKRSLFIEPSAQKRWYFARQRGEATAEHITKYFASKEVREHWRIVFKSYFVILKQMRQRYGKDFASNDNYRKCYSLITILFLSDVHDNYTDITEEIVRKYITLYEPIAGGCTETSIQSITF